MKRRLDWAFTSTFFLSVMTLEVAERWLGPNLDDDPGQRAAA